MLINSSWGTWGSETSPLAAELSPQSTHGIVLWDQTCQPQSCEKLWNVKVLILGVAYTQTQTRDRLKFRAPHYQRPLRRMETVKIPSWVIWFHWLNKHKPSLSLPSILAHFFQGSLEDSRGVTMGHWVKMLVAQSADMSSIPGAHSWKEGFLLTPVCS